MRLWSPSGLFFFFAAALLVLSIQTPVTRPAPPPPPPLSSNSHNPLHLPSGLAAPGKPWRTASDQLAGVPEDPKLFHPASPGARSILESDGRELVLSASSDGKVHLWDRASGKTICSIPTGGNLKEQIVFTGDPSAYFMFLGEDGLMSEFSEVFGKRNLNSTIEELVDKAPIFKGPYTVIGSKTTTIVSIDSDTGKVLHRYSLPEACPVPGVPNVDGKPGLPMLESSKGATNAVVVTLVRIDYKLACYSHGKTLWTINDAHITAYKSDYRHELLPMMGDLLVGPPKRIPVHMIQGSLPQKGDMLVGFPLHQMNIPVDSRDESGQESMLMLPFAAVKEVSSTVMPNDQLEISNSSLPSASRKNDEGTMFSSAHQLEHHLIKNVEQMSANSLNSGSSDNADVVSRSAAHHKLQQDYADGSLEEEDFGARRYSTKMFPKSILTMLIVILFVVALTGVRFLKQTEQNNKGKQNSEMKGRQPVTSKKRRSRKSGNLKGGVIINGNDGHSSGKENAEADERANVHLDNRFSFMSQIQAEDASGGRWVGRLFVSSTEIGKGSNGTVVLEGAYDGRSVAVKRLLRAHHDVALKEIQNLVASDWHPNIVRLYGVEQDVDFVYIALERCICSLSDLIQVCSDSSLQSELSESANLHSLNEHNNQLDFAKGVSKDLELCRSDGFPSSQLIKLMRDVVSGLAHLHELGIVHRDLKPQNVLISSDRFLNAKLSDMGISKRLLDNMSSLGHHATGYGSSGWQAPEQLLKGRQTRSVDLFSLGCILFFCITKGKHPFGGYYERDTNILNNRMDLFLVDHIPEAVHLLSQLLDANPEMRPSAVQVLHHPFFWSSEMRLSFLRDTSDRVELEDRESESELLTALENVAQMAFGGNWGEKLDAAFITDMGRYRKYNFDFTRDLLRVIRNKLNHYRELPKDLQEILGPVPEGFYSYFSNRFPNLLIEVYKVISRYCREDDCFSKYFKCSLV